MDSFNPFQRNNLITGIHLATEIQSSSPGLRAFVVVGAYIQSSSGKHAKPSKSLNVEQDNLRFWLRRYEVNRNLLETDKYIADQDLLNPVYIEDIKSIEQLEAELWKYSGDFSLMVVAWKVDNPLP
jgi:hypothetical protein